MSKTYTLTSDERLTLLKSLDCYRDWRNKFLQDDQISAEDKSKYEDQLIETQRLITMLSH